MVMTFRAAEDHPVLVVLHNGSNICLFKTHQSFIFLLSFFRIVVSVSFCSFRGFDGLVSRPMRLLPGKNFLSRAERFYRF